MTQFPPGAPAVQPRASVLAITSLVCGIAGFCTAGLGGLVGLILGIMALGRIKRSGGTVGGRGLAIAGIILSIISLLLMVVAVGAGLMMGYFVSSEFEPRVSNRANIASSQADIANLDRAIETFKVDYGRYPTTEEGLQALLSPPADIKGWSGPYLNAVPLDRWGKPYVYLSPGRHNQVGYDIYSCGPDTVDGTPDDIGNW